jgi:hypothetical protein
LTATGQLVGTLRYLAPEQLRGAPATPMSDVHALAAVTYEMLAGAPAYEAASPVALAEAHARGVGPIPNVPPALDATVRRALAPDPDARPADAAAFAAELEAAVGQDRTEPIPVGAGGLDVTTELPAIGAPLGVPPPGALWAPSGRASDAAGSAAILAGSGPRWATALPRAGRRAPQSSPPGAAATVRTAQGDGRPRAGLIALSLALLLLVGAAIASALAPGLAGRGTPLGTTAPAAAPIVEESPSLEPSQPPPSAKEEGGGKGKGHDDGKGKGHGGGD